MSKLNLPNLKRLCAGAHPGKWAVINPALYQVIAATVPAEPNVVEVIAQTIHHKNNADYIAAANPSTVSQLIECVEIMREVMVDVRSELTTGNPSHEWMIDHICKALSEVAKRVEDV